MKKNKWKLGVATVVMGMALLFGGTDYVSAVTSDQVSDNQDAVADHVIATKDEFVDFANNADKFSGKLVQLANDIKFDGFPGNYKPAKKFSGTFDGCGYTISGINVTDYSGDTGLFGRVDGGVVKNVTLEDCYFSSSSSTGGIAGWCYGGVINNCHVKNTTVISGKSRAGGICGDYGYIVNCSSNANVTGYSYAGGIGGLDSQIRNCYNYSSVEATQYDDSSYGYAGGIAGYTDKTVQNCYSIGAVKGRYTGGVVAKSDGLVVYCYCLNEYSPVEIWPKNPEHMDTNKAYAASYMQSADFLDQLNNNRGDNADWFLWEVREGSSYPQHVQLTSIDNYTLTLSNETYTYNEKPCTPTVTVSNGATVLKQNTDYEVIYSNNVNAGTASVAVRGNGMYIGNLKKTFTINKAASVITCTSAYEKQENSYDFSLDAKLTTGKGDLTYTSDNPGVAEVRSSGYVTIKAIGVANITISVPESDNYNAASVVSTVTVVPTPKNQITDYEITLDNGSYTYNGIAYTPNVTVIKQKIRESWRERNVYLEKDVDYTVTYSNNVEAGVATVVVTGIGEYGGEKIFNYNIDKANAEITCTNSYNKAYGSGTFALNVTKTAGESGLVFVSSNPEVATVDTAGKVALKGIGIAQITVSVPESKNFNATSDTITVTVRPKTPKLKKLSVSGKKLKFQWQRDKKVTGYEVQYSTYPTFTYNCQTKVIKKNSRTTYTSKVIQRKIKYYARVRSYKNVMVNGRLQTIYSDWSKVKNKTRR